MNRLFTFGCSFTSYKWPTWADIISKEFDSFENWAQQGCGNQFIFNSLIECLVKNDLGPMDTVVIMWTNIAREDRYVKGHWLGAGSIYAQDRYSQEFVREFADERGYLIRDLAVIHAAKKLLEHYGVKHDFLSLVPITKVDEIEDMVIDRADEIITAYKDTLEYIKPSIYDLVFNGDFTSRPFLPRKDYEAVQEKYEQVAGEHWPSFDDFLLNDFSAVPDQVRGEIIDENKWGWRRLLSKYNRIDNHATPGEHLEYVDIVLPKFKITAETRAWIDDIDRDLRQGKNITWQTNKPNRW